MSKYKKELDEMTWSFSRVNSYKGCPYQFYLQYIEENKNGISNFYAELGSFMHHVLESVLKDEMKIEDAADYFVNNIDKHVFSEIKKSTADKSIEACIEYLATTNLEMLDGFEIVGVELKCEYTINDVYDQVGFIDLLIKHKEEGYYVVVDHKSSGYPLKKDGGVLKSKEEVFRDYKRQAYLYSTYIYGEYGEFPKQIWWNHFKENKVAKIDFNPDEYKEAIKWFVSTIGDIYQDSDFMPNQNYFTCNVLCDFREECVYNVYGE